MSSETVRLASFDEWIDQFEPLASSPDTGELHIAEPYNSGNVPDAFFGTLAILETAQDMGGWYHFATSRQAARIILSSDPTSADLWTNTRDELLMTSQYRRTLVESEHDESVNIALSEAVARTDEAYRVGIPKAEQDGYLPHGTLGRFNEVRHHLKVRGATKPVRLAAYTLGNQAAYRLQDNEMIVYANIADILRYDDLGDPDRDPSTISAALDNIGHEYSHAMSGSTLIFDPTKAMGISRVRFGMIEDNSGNDTGRVIYGAFGEAVNQVINLGILTGDFETLDPRKRKDGSDVYSQLRVILADVYDKSGGILKVKTLTNASMEDTGPNGSFQERKKFISEFVAAYGYGSLRKLKILMQNVLISSLNDPESIDLNSVRDRIKPPLLDEYGNILEPGSINVDDVI